jgi:hypothetical protein
VTGLVREFERFRREHRGVKHYVVILDAGHVQRCVIAPRLDADIAFPPADHPEIIPGNPASNFGVASRKMFCHLGIASWSLMPVPGGLLVSYKGLDAAVGEPVPRGANQRGSWKT